MSTTDFEIAFVIPELTDAFDPRVSQVEEEMDIVVSSHSGLAVATVIAAGRDAVAVGRAATAILSSCGLPPQRTYPDLVSRQDVADRLEVSRQAVGNWVRGERHQAHPFPSPVNLVAGGVWLWGDVSLWLRRTERDCGDELAFPTLEDHARMDGILATVPRKASEPRGSRFVHTHSVGSVSARASFTSPMSGKKAHSTNSSYMVLCREPA